MFLRNKAPRTVAALIALILASPTPSWAGAQQSARLRIEILEGEAAINVVRQRSARDPVVRVVDENNKPVAGAAVVFTLPSRGPGATFGDGSRLLATTTDAQGQASATGVTANSSEGSYQINVTASHQGLTATTTVQQVNAAAGAAAGAAPAGVAAGAGGIPTKVLIAILIAAGAGGAAAAAVATGGGNGSGNPGAAPQATISIGQPTAGPPGR